MGFATKVQLIKRKSSEQWYINFPSAVAQAMEFDRGEVVEWFIEDKETLVLHRPEAAGRKLKKNPARLSSVKSKGSSRSAGEPSGKSGTGRGPGG
ncbi:MAG: hypothetical protein AB1700_16020 [Bacillota bacterium]